VEERFFVPWRKRTWASLIWTALTVAVGVYLGLAIAAPSPSCPPNDFYCAVGAGAEDSANGILLVLLFLAWVVAWLVGLGVIRLLVRFRDRRRQRRQIQQLEMRREEMHIKL
jgi:uncharacterized membrane protein HdeD (DUF308 family)